VIEEAPTILEAQISMGGELTITFDQEMRVPRNLPNDYDMKLLMISDIGISEGKYFFYTGEENSRLLQDE
jgi:hypothetical protein